MTMSLLSFGAPVSLKFGNTEPGKEISANRNPDPMALEFVEHILTLTHSHALKWEFWPHQPCPTQLPSGETRVVYSDMAYAVDPNLTRPDGTGQHYTYTVWFRPETGKNLVMKGENQTDREAMIFSADQIGPQNFQNLVGLIRESLKPVGTR